MPQQEPLARPLQKKVLIADDERLLVEALAATLDLERLETLVAFDGDQALAIARAHRPDLILLDVMMPGLSGFEVCAILKQETLTASIPIVLITAKGEKQNREAGMAAGAEAYLTKPFSPTRLIDLVNRLLAGHPAQPQRGEPDLVEMPTDQLVIYARELRELIGREQRYRQRLEETHRQLGELDRLKTAFLSAVTHELLTPFAAIGLPLQVLQRQGKDLTEDQRNALDDLATEIAGLHQLVKGVVKFAELMNKRRKPRLGFYALDRLIPPAVEPVAILARARQTDFRCFIPHKLPKVHADPELLCEAVFQMAHNAVKFNTPGGWAQTKAFPIDGWVVVEVSDTGVGLTAERVAVLGQPFEQGADALRRGREGLGIGWTIARYVADAHGGWTRVESPGPGKGSTFSLALPALG